MTGGKFSTSLSDTIADWLQINLDTWTTILIVFIYSRNRVCYLTGFAFVVIPFSSFNFRNEFSLLDSFIISVIFISQRYIHPFFYLMYIKPTLLQCHVLAGQRYTW